MEPHPLVSGNGIYRDPSHHASDDNLGGSIEPYPSLAPEHPSEHHAPASDSGEYTTPSQRSLAGNPSKCMSAYLQ